MYFATQVLAAIAAISVVSASDYFPFEYPSECITSCSLKAGKKCWSNYTQDETDPNFVQSFSCLCDTSNPGNGAFMANSLQCLTESKCDGKDIMTSMGLQGPICEWYNQHKNDPKPTETPEPTITSTKTPEPTTTSTETPEPTTTSTETPEPTTTTTETSEPTTTTTETSEPATTTTETSEPTTTSTEAEKPTETTETQESSKTSETTTQEPTSTTESQKPTETQVSTETTAIVDPTCPVVTVTVTTTVYETEVAPQPTDVTCEHGAYKCVDSGKSTKYTICVHGKSVDNACAPGTVCKTSGNSIICDWA
ncbi:hypothetical protein K7432_008510 [Basidiobolus ranarum]|uniref:Uncharacterized protein n=1 Tax=Basidiobolus ranarum TaxID=34480 RepID=A0ABR2WRS4_9FUNG